MRRFLTTVLVLSFACVAFAEDIFRESFGTPTPAPPLHHTWGDKPIAVIDNKVEKGSAHLGLAYPAEVKHNLSYWTYKLAEPVPIAPQLETISFRVKTDVPVWIKIGIRPFNFIYHGPGVGASPDWQTVTLKDAYEELRKWCENGKRNPADGFVDKVIVAVGNKANTKADILVDDIALEGPSGAKKAVEHERFIRQTRRIHIAAISLVWDEGHRTLANTLTALDEAGILNADIACLPQECVDQPPEPIPGPASMAIARKAAEHDMYVIGNLREGEGDRIYITSFLCDRQGEIVGTYRKSHKLPFDGDISLGDDLPVFNTDFGAVGMKIGTDHYFPEIDRVLRSRGASLIVWSTLPFPQRDEHQITTLVKGRALQYSANIAVARYAGKEGYGGYSNRFSWCGSWPLGRAQVFARDGHTVADSGHRGGVAIASLPRTMLGGGSRDGGYPTEGKFSLITADEIPPPQTRTPDMKRVIRAAAIECDTNLDRLDAKLDECGASGCDIACLWEYVWYRKDEEVERYRQRNQKRLARIAAAAKRNKMYVVIAGELERGFNESILYDRQGEEIGRYTKINQTTSRDSKYFRAGQKVGVFDLDFGRICTKICADVGAHEIDRVAGLHQVDLLLLHTQDAGPYSEAIRSRDGHRCMDNGYFLLRAAGGGVETDHRTYIMDPWGMVLAGSQRGVANSPVISTIDLDSRPKYYEWPPEHSRAKNPVKHGIPEAEQKKRMYGRLNRPVARGELRAVVLKQRRPELYRPKKPKK
ncbi:MAG: carbon-nitrogen hydrolase family protein [Lentisphaerae bacterium]|jgi:predicted amidohydrolase|nr:carbon-nitrogen hydrolase family protein [Lentisphaerota bacterium]MBT4822083.1 carbon-nitrogen hydrolase family protein [Lentisphaerota bacterium]MBT5611525.1 carbon-nitrogen hydrolase family protein [Lentisphaerota bacterium]MBT7054761.1 carbon-nitrogen hydrolase family protein [Lentisphaerota bacterium]MBT7844285.1 carbon-nitrogen hydrolase family protein [Lentisphaerota bacterium]